MLPKKILFLLTLGLTLGLISSEITFQYDIDKAQIRVRGNNSEIIGNEARVFFQVDDNQLKKDVEKIHGALPTDVYVRSPTPWNNLFQSYNWKEVKNYYFVKKVNIVSTNFITEVLDQRKFANYNSTAAVKFFSQLNNTYPIVISHERTKIHGSSDENLLTYSFSLKINAKEPPKVFNYTTHWAEMHREEFHENLRPGSLRSEFSLKQHETGVHSFIATKVRIEIEIKYIEVLRGQVVMNYADPYKGHHFYAMDIKSALKDGSNKPKEVLSTEKIIITYFKDYKATLKVNDTFFSEIKLIDIAF